MSALSTNMRRASKRSRWPRRLACIVSAAFDSSFRSRRTDWPRSRLCTLRAAVDSSFRRSKSFCELRYFCRPSMPRIEVCSTSAAAAALLSSAAAAALLLESFAACLFDSAAWRATLARVTLCSIVAAFSWPERCASYAASASALRCCSAARSFFCFATARACLPRAAAASFVPAPSSFSASSFAVFASMVRKRWRRYAAQISATRFRSCFCRNVTMALCRSWWWMSPRSRAVSSSI
mmetsp:Transcript_84348/g.252962  ORF Transcript_84348/g.252962 Transcript_84348/m.252962 type:complete len:237 (+) Transcript_84348:960-1670(+)